MTDTKVRKLNNRQKSYNFDSVDFFNRYYKKGWESPRDVKSGYYAIKQGKKYSTKPGSIQLTQIGYKPFKLSPENFSRKNSKIKNSPDGKTKSSIPEFLKHAIPMERIVPSSIMSQRRMDIILPGYSRTRSYNKAIPK